MRKYLILSLFVVGAVGCRHRVALGVSEEKHLISVKKSREALYLDRLDNRVVLQRVDTMGSTRFCSFLVGIRDSLVVTDAEKKREREKYLQYDMQQDWTALVGGDSLKPVFMQEKPNLGGELREDALVFEIPKGVEADTLVYRDSFGDWGTQVFVLNEK